MRQQAETPEANQVFMRGWPGCGSDHKSAMLPLRVGHLWSEVEKFKNTSPRMPLNAYARMQAPVLPKNKTTSRRVFGHRLTTYEMKIPSLDARRDTGVMPSIRMNRAS